MASIFYCWTKSVLNELIQLILFYEVKAKEEALAISMQPVSYKKGKVEPFLFVLTWLLSEILVQNNFINLKFYSFENSKYESRVRL